MYICLERIGLSPLYIRNRRPCLVDHSLHRYLISLGLFGKHYLCICLGIVFYINEREVTHSPLYFEIVGRVSSITLCTGISSLQELFGRHYLCICLGIVFYIDGQMLEHLDIYTTNNPICRFFFQLLETFACALMCLGIAFPSVVFFSSYLGGITIA